MYFSSFRKFFVLALVAVSGAVVINFGVQMALNSLLHNDANSTGMDWAHHIDASVDSEHDIESLSTQSAKNQGENASNLSSLIAQVLAVGNIYQIDFIKPGCLCDISIIPAAASAGTNTHDMHAHHGGKDGKNDSVHQAHAKHGSAADGTAHGAIDHSEHNHSRAHHAAKLGRPMLDPDQSFQVVRNGEKMIENSPDSLSSVRYDPEHVQKLAETLQHSITVYTNNPDIQQFAVGEIYHPIVRNGETISVLRLLVNLEQKYLTYVWTLYVGVGFVVFWIVLMLGIFGVQSWRSVKKQKISNERAHYLASHDTLTKICNRNAFSTNAPKIFAESKKNGKLTCLILFDFNNFKDVNDYHGHFAGDQLLINFARLLKQNFDPKAIAARLGGDEFVVVVGNLDADDPEFIDRLNIPTSFETSINDGQQVIETKVSAGVVVIPDDGEDLEMLMRNADLALYDAKASGGGGIRVYEEKLGEAFLEHVQVRAAFAEGLERGEIEPYYQPLVNIETGEVEGLEALARWNHPERGVLTPFVFADLLTERELGARVGEQMLEQTARRMAEWKRKSIPFGRVSINIGEGDLLKPAFALNVLTVLEKNGINPEQLAIEVTETCMFGESKAQFIRHLENLLLAGCTIALDDFGTGYSSIMQIKELPCTALKIDKSFVKEAVGSAADRAIITALVGLGQSIGFNIVAEGVETEEQLTLLANLGCHHAQGYYHSRPIPASEVPAMITMINRSARTKRGLKIA